MKKSVLSIISVLSLVANAQNSLQPISGVNYAGFQNVGAQYCAFVSENAYQCTSVSPDGTQVLATHIIEFKSQEELCQSLRNDNLNSVAVAGLQHSISTNVRKNYTLNNCAPSTGATLPQGPALLKNMTCRLVVEATDGASGDSGVMQIPVAASGTRNGIFANMSLQKVGPTFSTVLKRLSHRYIDFTFTFQKGLANQSDQLSIEAKQKYNKAFTGTAVVIKGDARSGVALKIKDWGDVTNAEIQCAVTDAQISTDVNTKTDYSCQTTGTDSVVTQTLTSSVANLLGQALVFSDSNSRSNVSLAAEIPSTAKFSAKFNATSSSQVIAKANLNNPTEFKVNNLSRTSLTRCK